MNLNERKLEIIEEILHLSDESKIAFLENALKLSNKKSSAKLSDFSGILSDKEAEKMRKVIEETCEVIYEEDWK